MHAVKTVVAGGKGDLEPCNRKQHTGDYNVTDVRLKLELATLTTVHVFDDLFSYFFLDDIILKCTTFHVKITIFTFLKQETANGHLIQSGASAPSHAMEEIKIEHESCNNLH